MFVALSDAHRVLLRRMMADLAGRRRDLERLDAYYEGQHRIEQLGLAIPPQLERFTTVVNWPRVTVDSIEQRCDVEGFQLADVDGADDDLWRIWQANGLDEESQMGHLEALALGRSYACVGMRDPDGDPDPDVPLVTVESPFEMTHETNPRTQQVTAALRHVAAVPGTREQVTLYLPDETIWLERRGAGGWFELDRDQHGLKRTPVVPLVNRPRLRRRAGVSEMADVIGLSDAACRALTNAQIATEVLAVPQRYVLGAAPTDFVDKDGKPLTAWETYFGAVWALENGEAKVGQFSAADLSNFEKIVNHYANLVSGVSGLPTRFYGQYTTNPPSEGSIVADESRLIMRAYRLHRGLGGSWEQVMRLVRRMVDGDYNPDLRRMETLWRNPETPTRAQVADAVVKLVGAKLLPVEGAWEELGYSATRRKRLKLLRDAELAADPLKVAADAFRLPSRDADPAGGDPAGGGAGDVGAA